VRSSPSHTAYVRFSPESVWDATNPWTGAREWVLEEGADIDFDVLFLSGVDWRRVIPEHERPEYHRPVVNLVQHVRHGCESDPLGRHMLLRHKAIRICVSSEVEQAILATGRVRGPVFTIPDAIDLDEVVRTRPGPCRSPATSRRPHCSRSSARGTDSPPDVAGVSKKILVGIALPAAGHLHQLLGYPG